MIIDEDAMAPMVRGEQDYLYQSVSGKSSPQEILDADLTGTVLAAAAWGEGDIAVLPWLTPPPAGRTRP